MTGCKTKKKIEVNQLKNMLPIHLLFERKKIEKGRKTTTVYPLIYFFQP